MFGWKYRKTWAAEKNINQSIDLWNIGIDMPKVAGMERETEENSKIIKEVQQTGGKQDKQTVGQNRWISIDL